MDQVLVASILIFISILLAGVGVLVYLSEKRKGKVRRRLHGDQLMATEAEAGDTATIVRDTSLSSIPALDQVLQQYSLFTRLGTTLTQADVSMQVGTFILVTILEFGFFQKGIPDSPARSITYPETGFLVYF